MTDNTKIMFCEGTESEILPPRANAGSTALWVAGFDNLGSYEDDGEEDGWYTNIIQRFEIASGGLSVDWGYLNVKTERMGCSSNGTGAFSIGGIGWYGLSDDAIDAMIRNDFYDETTTFNYGSLHTTNYDMASISDGITTVTAGGGDGWYLGVISDVSSFIMNVDVTNTKIADLRYNTENPKGASNFVYGLISGGYCYQLDPRYMKTTDTYEFATETDTTYFGDLSHHMMFHSSSGDMVTCLVIGGRGTDGYEYTDLDTVQKTEFASTGSFTQFGNMITDIWYRASTSDNTYSVTSGGWDNADLNYLEMITFASGGQATEWGDISKLVGALGATSGTMISPQYLCEMDTIFNISTYITLSKVELDTKMPYVSLFTVEEPTTINMRQVTVNRNIDASIDNLEHLKIYMSSFLMSNPLTLSDITMIDVNNLTIDANHDALQYEEQQFACKISRSDISQFITDITIETDPEDSTETTFLEIEDSFAEVLDVSGTETRIEPEEPPIEPPEPEVAYAKVFSGTMANRSFAIKTDGTLWATGEGDSGEFGDGLADYFEYFYQVGTDTDWDQIATGEYHSIALKTDGSMWVTGMNGDGQLGLGHNTNQTIWQPIAGTWKKIACGKRCSLAIDSNDTLWGTGENGSGELGLGDSGSYNTWTSIPIGEGYVSYPVLEVASGYYHSLVIADGGESRVLMSTGFNREGQLGQNHFDWNTYDFVVVSSGWRNWQKITCGWETSFATLYSNEEGNILYSCGTGDLTGQGTYDQTNVFTREFYNYGGFSTISGGSAHCMALLADGISGEDIVGTGYDDYGQLGRDLSGDYEIKFEQEYWEYYWLDVACGYDHTIAIKSDGTLWACGQNNLGQCGLGNDSNATIFTQTGI